MPAVKVLNGEKHLERTKHAIVKIEFIRDLIQREIISCRHKVTGEQMGDIGAKSPTRTLFKTHRDSLGLEPCDFSELLNEGVCDFMIVLKRAYA